jgi:hypothetical protein
MEKDRDQLTPDDPDDLAKIERSRGQGTGASGLDMLPGEEGTGPSAADEAAADS